jgi:aminoglycoside 2'-N-acetyltransferase I
VRIRQPVGVPAIRLFTTAEASDDLLREIRHLLEEAFDGDFSDDDWEHSLGGWHVVVADGGFAVSHAAVVPRVLDVGGRPFHAGYVEAVATAPGRQREGLGALAMGELARVLQREFELGALSTGLHEFYARLGWERWRGPTFVRAGAEAIRTEDEDDGVMVLRFGPSAGIDVAAPISCEARHGDDW